MANICQEFKERGKVKVNWKFHNENEADDESLLYADEQQEITDNII